MSFAQNVDTKYQLQQKSEFAITGDADLYASRVHTHARKFQRPGSKIGAFQIIAIIQSGIAEQRATAVHIFAVVEFVVMCKSMSNSEREP